MGSPSSSRIRRCVLLCAILGGHLFLISRIAVNDNPSRVQRFEEAPAILFFVELPEPNDTRPSTRPSSRGPNSTYDSSHESSAAPDNAITPLPEIEGTDARIDWDAEASRVARDAASRMGEEKQTRSLDRQPAGMGPLPPKPSGHKLGDSQHLEGGEIIDWVGSGCYYSNQDAPIAAFGQALRLQIPTCTGARGATVIPLQSFEEWKKERDSR